MAISWFPVIISFGEFEAWLFSGGIATFSIQYLTLSIHVKTMYGPSSTVNWYQFTSRNLWTEKYGLFFVLYWCKNLASFPLPPSKKIISTSIHALEKVRISQLSCIEPCKYIKRKIICSKTCKFLEMKWKQPANDDCHCIYAESTRRTSPLPWCIVLPALAHVQRCSSSRTPLLQAEDSRSTSNWWMKVTILCLVWTFSLSFFLSVSSFSPPCHYRPQLSCGKVMLRLWFCSRDGGCGRHPSWADNPLGRHLPGRHPWADTPCQVHAQIHIPPPSPCWDTCPY